MNQNHKRNMRTICVLGVMSILLALLAACGSTGSGEPAAGEGEATPTPVPTPIVPEKPTYTVQRGTVVETLEFTGRGLACARARAVL